MENKQKFTSTDIIALILLILGVTGFISLPYLVTQKGWLNVFNSAFGKPNEIGDMIGGIVGPFIGLISAALVYLALREQIKANSIIINQIEVEKRSKIESENKNHIHLYLGKIENFLNAFEFKFSTKTYKANEATTEILRLYFFRYLRSGVWGGSSGDFILNHSYELFFNLKLLKSISDDLIKNINQSYNVRELFLDFSSIVNKFLPHHIFFEDSNNVLLSEYIIKTKVDLKYLECCFEIWTNHSIIHSKYTENDSLFKDHRFNIPNVDDLNKIKEVINHFRETLVY